MTDAAINNGLTATGFGLGSVGLLLGQVAQPGVEALTWLGIIGVSLPLAIRMAGEWAKAAELTKQAAEATKLASLHLIDKDREIADLKAEIGQMRALAQRGVCPLSDDGSPACGRQLTRGDA